MTETKHWRIDYDSAGDDKVFVLTLPPGVNDGSAVRDRLDPVAVRKAFFNIVGFSDEKKFRLLSVEQFSNDTWRGALRAVIAASDPEDVDKELKKYHQGECYAIE